MTNNKSILNHKNQILRQFSDFISIQSVSTDRLRHDQILKAVEFLKKEIKKLGFEIKIYQKNNCPPLIIGYLPSMIRSGKDGKAKTIGVYAHYDVQPEDPTGQWNSPPFKLTQKNGKLFGRGVADDKGHIIQILMAIKNIVETQNFASLHKSNIVLIFEGEEEIGSRNFEYLINQVKPSLDKVSEGLENVDVFYILDMGMKAKNIPQIFYGLRGLLAFELKIKTNETDLHSGVYGNQALNPAQILSELMSKMKDSRTTKIKIPGFYDQVKKISQKETFLLSKSDNNLSTKINPSLDINGMISGYTGEGSKTIIPGEATVKFSVRLVPDQQQQTIKRIVEKFVKVNLPREIKYELKTSAGSDPFYTDYKNKYVRKTAEIFKKVFKNQTVISRSGATIGAAEILQRLFKKPIILTGFTLADCKIHAPNENIDEEMFEKGITSLEKIFSL